MQREKINSAKRYSSKYQKSYFYDPQAFPEVIVNKSGRIKSLSESCHFSIDLDDEPKPKSLSESCRFSKDLDDEPYVRKLKK